nr:ATP-binding cassette domain-containing protein [Echinimonas agarilytica]
MQSAVVLEQLRFAYDGTRTDIINIPEWRLNMAEKCFVFGASGTGKSTLMNLLSGVLKPTSGTITLFDQELTAMSARQKDQFRAQHIGVVFQQFNLIPYLSVAENIQLAAWFGGKPRLIQDEAFTQRLLGLLDALKLKPELLQRSSGELSVGQQQRVAIARALINEPELLIVDEPTSSLDTHARNSFMKHLMAICSAQNSALLFVSHDLSLQSHFDVAVDLAELNQLERAPS